MLEELKERVYRANMMLPENKLVISTWGNVSEIDREKGLFVIKPSGVEYKDLSPDKMVVCDLKGNVVEGNLRPSSDMFTHLELYKNFSNANAIVHTHSRWATIWAQAGKSISAYGTTHADYFYGAIPITRKMTDEEISTEYERNTGRVIVETFVTHRTSPSKMNACLVHSHGPFLWGDDAVSTVEKAVVLEEIAFMAWHTEMLAYKKEVSTMKMQQQLLDKHFLRKHGDNAYYGQQR